MASRSTEMQAIFNELSERNKDIVILIAKSVKVAQEVTDKPRKPTMQTVQSRRDSGTEPGRLFLSERMDSLPFAENRIS